MYKTSIRFFLCTLVLFFSSQAVTHGLISGQKIKPIKIKSLKVMPFKKIPLHDEFPNHITFPSTFLKGCALSAFQNGGHLVGTESNWSQWEKKEIRCNAQNLRLYPGSTIAKNHRVSVSNDFYTHAFEDIQLLKDLGCNSLRFSVEWADIEPREGEFNYELLLWYRSFCQALLDNGIVPMVTLYHFVHPLWFEKKGGFEHGKNIADFVDYCKVVFEYVGDVVPLWCTINEPTVLGACGYVLGIHPPGALFAFRRAAILLANLLRAHVVVYQELKKMPHGQEAKIGFAHQMILFEPYLYVWKMPFFGGISFSDPFSRALAAGMSHIFCHSLVMEFFRTGNYEYQLPMGKNIRMSIPSAPESIDFFGLNFYSNVTLAPHPTCYAQETMTEMDYPVRPHKMYEALREVAMLGKPIYITENGLSDSKDVHRPYFIKSYLSAVHRAVQEGCDIRGYYHWTLMDNFEWSEGYTKNFGLYAVDFNDPLRTRTPRSSCKVYRDFMAIAA